jgi:ribosomal protein S18 acetylase RimI-like enzyme
LVFEADGAAVCGFQEETYKLNFPDFQYTAAFAEAFRYDLRRAGLDPNHGIFVLDDGRQTPPGKCGNIAGFLWVVMAQNSWSGERHGYINNLYVAPERRGAGLGRELMKHADEFFRSRGIRRVRLTVTHTNEAAVKLYRACGYATDRWEMHKEL